MLLELHAHTSKHSACSKIDPLTLVSSIKSKQLQGLIITEHHYLWTDDELADLRYEARLDNHFLLFAGQEIETNIGHIVVLGASSTIKQQDKLYNLNDIRQIYPDAAFIWAHPFRKRLPDTKEELFNPSIDAVEIFNTNQTMQENYFALSKWHEYKFNAVAGSDTHTPQTAGVYPTQFDHPIYTINDIVAEIKAKRCRPFFKEIPKSGTNLSVTEITIGTKGDDELRNRLIVKHVDDPKKWEAHKNSADIMQALYRQGFDSGTYRVPKIIEMDIEKHLIIEEGQRGSSLFDLLQRVKSIIGMEYFKLAARWLARLHNTLIKISESGNALKLELHRFKSYEHNFIKSNSPYLRDCQRIIASVRPSEEELALKSPDEFVQLHGDFHPKNIIIGQDRMQDISTLFISVIDFGSSINYLRSFDVGYFPAQSKSQFYRIGSLNDTYTERIFIDEYLQNAKKIPQNFEKDVKLFELRAFLGIASFFIKVGKGIGEEMSFVMQNAKNLLSQI